MNLYIYRAASVILLFLSFNVHAQIISLMGKTQACGSEVITYTAAVSSYNCTSSLKYFWTVTGSGGGSTVGGGGHFDNYIKVNISATATNVVIIVNVYCGDTYLGSGHLSNIRNAKPASPVANNVSICSKQSITLTASTSTSGANIAWFSSPSGGSPLHTGANFVTPVISSTTTYYVAAYVTNQGYCESNRTPVTITINNIGNPVVASASRCGKGSLEFTGALPNGSDVLKWYTSTGGFIMQGMTFKTPELSASTYYYVTGYNSVSGCEGPRVRVDANIQVMLPPGVTNNSRCGTGTVELHVTPSAGANSARWYASASGGEVLGTGNTFITPVLTNTKTYYVSSYLSYNGCESSPPYTPVTAFINAIPSAPTGVSGNTRFGEGRLNLVALGNSENYKWHDRNNSFLSQGKAYSTETVSRSEIAKYLLSSVNSEGCESSAIPIDVTIEPLPFIRADVGRVVKKIPVTLYTQLSNYDAYEWQDGDGKVVGTEPTLITDKPGKYYVKVTRQGVDGIGLSLPFNLGRQFDGQNKNYVVVNTMNVGHEQDPNNTSIEAASQKIVYYDGLGRPIQEVSTQASPSKSDIVKPIVYDGYGRQQKVYLPFTNSNDGWYKAKAENKANSFYSIETHLGVAKDDKPYASIEFEPSSLNRKSKEYGPGKLWDNNFVRTSYLSNKHSMTGSRIEEKIYAFEVLNGGSLAYASPLIGFILEGGYFDSNQISILEQIDENGNVSREYVNKNGELILKKNQIHKGSSNLNDPLSWASTYYVYDRYGNLAFVLPPECISKLPNLPITDLLNNWAFQYKYDALNRLTAKKVPGADWVYMVYDNRDRLVLTQDGNQRAYNLWTFTKYDDLNRPIATGIKDTTAALTPAEMQLGVNSHYAKSWAKYGETYIGAADKNVHGYSNFSYPTVTTAKTVDPNRYLTVTYYDNYSFKSYISGDYSYVNEELSETVNGIEYRQPATEFTSVIGQVTGTRVRVLDNFIAGGSIAWLSTVNYYDDKYRIVQTVSDNFRGGSDRVTNVYDFIGKVLKSRATHYGLSWANLVGTRRIGNRFDKTSTTNTWGNSSGVSVEKLPANTDGWVEFTAASNSKAIIVSLSTLSGTIYQLYLTSGAQFQINESGSPNLLVPSPAYSAGDVFRIERKSGKIRFYKNKFFLHERAATADALSIVFNIYSTGGVIYNIRSSFGSFNPQMITRRYEYDHAGRLTHTWHQIGSQSEILLSKNEYNELGQLIDKKLHSTNRQATDAKQSVDYRYNIRGWLTSINNAELNDDGITNDDASDYFGMNLAYNEALGTGNEEIKSNLNDVLISSYSFDGNANDDAPNGINGVVTAATLTIDSQGNSNKAYSFGSSSYIEIPNSLTKHSFIQNTGRFTISAFIKIENLNARNVIVGNTATSQGKGFTFMYETYGSGYGDHQLRFMTTLGTNSISFNALGGVRTINDNNWHHVAVVGDGHSVRFFVDGVQDGDATPITIFSTGASSNTTLIGKTRAAGGLFLGMIGSIDEVKILNRPTTQSEIQIFASRGEFNTVRDGRQYNGNISAMKWSVNQGLSDTKEMAYNFTYDPLNRLVSANNLQSAAIGIWTPGKFHEGELTYDLNGNIKTLTRYNETNAMDMLSYTYASGTNTGNQLLKVVDTGDKYKGFMDGTNTDNDYAYDANGNMTADKNKNITAITYNFLNLPTVVTRGQNKVNYIYDATGRKLSQITSFVNTVKQTDYAGEFQYEDDALQFVQHEEGRIVLSTEKQVYSNDGDDLNSVVTENGTSTSRVTQATDPAYIKVLSNGTTARGAIFGGMLAVQPGERYRIRAKGYRVGSNNVYLLARTNMGNILWGTNWLGAQLSTSLAAESWIEEVVTIPVGAIQLETGLYWSVATATDYFLVNDFEITKLGQNTTPEYQYHLKDHLGNVRLTFTTKVEEDIYTATFEDGTQTDETNNFKNYSRVTSDMFDHTDAGTVYKKAQMLNGSSGSQVGLAKTLSVMPGDVIKAEVYAKYLGAEGSSTNLSSFGAALLSAFNLSAPLAGETGTARAALQEYGAYIEGKGNPGNEDSPKGWLNILVFDREYNLVNLALEQLSSDYVQQVGSLVKAPHQLLSKEVEIKEPGYVYIYVSNEGSIAQEIYFDDFMISHKKSAVIETNDYYPFGLTFNSHRRENNLLNKYQYNGKELQNALDLNWLDYGARMYMSDIGRWGAIDPLSDLFMSISPYAYALNNPSTFNDIEGLLPGDPKYTGSGNVVIILDYGTPKDNWDPSTLDKTAWDYGVFGSLAEAADWVNRTYKKDGVAINRLVVRTHGYVPLSEDGSTELMFPSGDPVNPTRISSDDLDAGARSDVYGLKQIAQNLGQNAYVLFTACNACMNTDKLPAAIFRLLNAKNKNVTLFNNGTTTSLQTANGKVKVRRSLNYGLDPKNTYAPWKVTNSHGTFSLGKNVTPGLNIDGSFMWFYSSGGTSTVLGGGKVASPYHPHKFHGKE